MGEVAGMALVGSAGSKLGQMAAGGGEEPAQFDPFQYVGKANKTLDTYLNKGLNYSNNYTNKAIGAVNQGLQGATSAYNTGLQGATNAITGAAQQGFAQSQALQSPYALMGYNAADRYADSLGIARTKAGGAATAQGLFNASQFNPQLIQQLQQSAQAAGQSNPYGAGTAPTAVANPAITDAQIQAYMKANKANVKGQYASNNVKGISKGGMVVNPVTKQQVAYSPQAMQEAIKYAINPQYAQQQQAYGQYQQQQGLFNKFQQAQQQVGQNLANIDPNSLKMGMAYNQGLFGTPQVI